VIDVQNDFCPGGALAVAGGDEIISRINGLMDDFQTVVLTQDWHPATHASFAANHPGATPFSLTTMPYGPQVLWPTHCVQGTRGGRVSCSLAHRPSTTVVRKGFRPAIDSYSAFFENDQTTPTGLEGYLRNRGVTAVTLVGLATDYCVAYSALDAARLGFKATVLEGACAGHRPARQPCRGPRQDARGRRRAGGLTMVDIATRVWNHKWKIDPIVRSLIDTDFYKLLMCQSIFRNKPDTTVVFSLINRSTKVRLADLIDEGELREQLDHVRSLTLTRGESTWLRGNTFYGKRQMFRPDFMEWFEGMRLPAYHLEKRDGQFELTFEGRWPEVMLWEIPALAVLMELRSPRRPERHGQVRASGPLRPRHDPALGKDRTPAPIDGLKIADFGTRRRHGFLWQDWCVQAMQEGLGSKFIGTSNCLIAMNRDVEAIGTNAHELPMVYSALADSDEELRQAPYQVLADWHEEHDGNLRIILPDTYGTEGFLKNAPDWLAAGPASASTAAIRPPGRKPRSAGGRTGRGPDAEAGHLLGRAGCREDRRAFTPASRAG
jgi:nicotinic acid phosphoribosyltransferase/nicotinamidase-related amidase